MSELGFTLFPPPVRMHRWHQRGFSLVELMVAITIGFVVVAAVGYVYLSARQSFRTTDNMSRMQENARLAIETLARDVRVAGYIGCGNLQTISVNTIAKPPVLPISTENAITGQDFTGAVVDFAGTTIDRPAGDSISIMGAFGGNVRLDPSQPGGVNIKIIGNPIDIVQNDVILLSDCTKAATLQVTNNPGNGGVVTITHGGNLNIVTPGLGSQYLPDGVMIKMERFTYFIGINPDGKRALYRTNLTTGVAQGTVELVEDVWDMQIEYGRDTNADGTADIYGDATAVGANWAQVVSARINLLLVSPENNIVTSPQTYIFDNASVAAGDRRMYQSFNATIGIRNRLP